MKYETVSIGSSLTVESAIEAREKVLKLFPSAKNFSLVTYEEYGCHYIALEYCREETPEELEQKAKIERNRLASERELYNRLKKKFGESDV